MRLSALPAACGLVIAALAAAAAEAPPLILEHLTPADGLPQGTVMATLQDSQGFIWLGTEDGLVRYDGHDLVRYAYSRSAPNGLPGNFIWQIVEDRQHDLWVAIKDEGIARWNRATDAFTVFRHDPARPRSIASDATRALLVDDRGRIWVGTSGAGIDVIEPRSGDIQHLRHEAGDPNSLASDQIFTLSMDRQGVVWAGTARGLDRFQAATLSFVHMGRDAGQISQILEDRHGARWVGSFDGGLARLEQSGDVSAVFRHSDAEPGSLSSNDVRAVLEDRAGHIWVGTPEGLDLLDPASQTFTHFRHEEGDADSLRDSFIMSLYEDSAGVVWIGTRAGGVSRWNPRSWELGAHRPPWLVGKLVTAFADAPDHKVWVGSEGGGLVRFDAASGEAASLDSLLGRRNALGDSRVMALRTGRDETLWIGTMGGGLKKLSPAGQLESIPVKPGNPGGTSAAGIMTIFESRIGEIWLGTHGGGVNVLDPVTGVIRQLPFAPKAPGATSDDSVSAIAEDASGYVWLGTDGGGLDLARADGTVVKVFKQDANDPSSLPSNTIYAVAVDGKGGVWVATDKGGVAHVLGTPAEPDRIRFETLSREQGLSSDTIYAILPDGDGQLWLSGNSGLMRFDPASRHIKTFHREHGLQSEEFDYNAYLRLRDGRLCFGGPGGFNIFEPGQLTDNERAPRIALTRMEVLGAPVASATPYWLVDRIVVDHRASIISLDFGALDFTSPKRNRLQYRITGLSDRWIDLGTQRRVTLTNLDAGDHLLEARAANADSVWSQPMRLVIHRDPAPWRSGWAYTAYAALLLLLIAQRVRMSRAKIQRIVRDKERLESEVASRTSELVESNRQLEEASQAKSNFLARMSHELRTPMNGVLGSTELLARTGQSATQKRLTETIRSSAGVLLQIVNDLLDLSKIQAGKLELERVAVDLDAIIEECATLFAGAAEKKGIEIVVCPAQRPLGALSGDPLRIRQVLMNLIGNAVKFTPQGEIVVKAGVESGGQGVEHVTLTVSDTGIGMDAQAIRRIFEPFTQADESTTRRYGGSGLGLAICRELAERMGGSIDVDSTPNAGSTFIVRLPLRAAAAAAPDAESAAVPAAQGSVQVCILTRRPALREALVRQVEILGHWVVAQESAHAGAPPRAQVSVADYSTQQSWIETQLAAQAKPANLVIVASSAQVEALQAAHHVSPDMLVHKPVHRAQLSAALAACCTHAPQRGAEIAEPPPQARGHVLLVEDESVNAVVGQGYLQALGCTCVWVSSGIEAISRSASERFDLIMMDLNMPAMDGFAATRSIRRREGDGQRVPIVALTAHDVGAYRERCLQAGMDDLLSKPYTLEQCAQMVRKWAADSAARPPQARADDEDEVARLSHIDPTTVEGMRRLRGEGSGDLYSQLVDLFSASSVDSLGRLRAAVERQDFAAAKALCHKLAAASANVGALAFGREVRALEDVCDSGDAADAARLCRRIAAAHAALLGELAALRIREIA